MSNKAGTVALIVSEHTSAPKLVDSLSDDREIAAFEAAMQAGQTNPLKSVYSLRARQAREDEEFSNYVEELLSQPFVRPEIAEHGVQWFKSKIRIEKYQKCENEATRVIAQYAFEIFRDNRKQTDFILAGPTAKVRVRIYTVPQSEVEPASEAA